MKVVQLLERYPDEALDQLARDKVDEIANLRLPRAVLIREIAAALSSRSYVVRALSATRPPSHAFLKLLIEARDLSAPVDGFHEAVLQLTDRLTAQAASGAGLSTKKNYALYLRLLFAGWEDDNRLDRSEARMLEALRRELGISVREHLLLEHHPDIRPLWDSPRAYEDTRNHLLTTGLVLMHESRYALAEEVAHQVRTSWDIALEDVSYARLLDRLTGAQLREVLETAGLPLSGSKEDRATRLIEGLISPFEVLDRLHINDVKELCRSCGLPVSAAKNDLIAAVIDWFDADRDLEAAEEAEKKKLPAPVIELEPRVLPNEVFEALLSRLTNDQLYDMLAGSAAPRSGSKPQRVLNVLSTSFSERTLLGHLRRTDLAELCRRAGAGISGPKEELVDRIIAWAQHVPVAELRREQAPVAERVQAEEENEATTRSQPAVDQDPPPGLRGIHADFPGLEPDEQIILALLESARSLTERDIERAAARHGLGWFLTKAHMADLIAKLAQSGRRPLRIRSAGGVNIYEWIGAVDHAGGGIERDAARGLVDALRQGVVPESHLDLLAVGQEDARKHLVDLLLHVRSGRTAFKFIRGPYGAGKTFLCAWLREQALKHELGVASVRIGPDQPLSDLPVFFSGLMNGLRTPEKRDASALADIIESWLLALHRKTAQVEGLAAFEASTREKLAPLVEKRIEEEVGRLSKHDPGFGPAVLAFYRARARGDETQAATAIAWLRGSTATAAQRLREIGVSGHLEAHQVFPRLRALLEMIATDRLRGLLILVDELELVRRFPHQRQREAAYETLRGLIDECGENQLPGCLFAFTATDALFDDQRYGLGSYPALAHRIEAPRGVEGLVSMRQPVIQLRGLDRERLLAVSQRVRDVHGAAYGWNAGQRLPDALLERFVENWTAFGGESVERLPRPILKELVHVLDLCEENPDVDPADCLRGQVVANDLATSVVELLEA